MKLHVISLGAGVQSTTMALMAAHGEITPMPSAAIFSDTGWEPAGVYNHLKWLMSGNVLPFPVHIVNNGNIRDALTTAEPGRWRQKEGAAPGSTGNTRMTTRRVIVETPYAASGKYTCLEHCDYAEMAVRR
tara:strand:+ start:1068 stop:1460 length:393 start_codon:yes stop_codon:yes gene_type:complete